MFFLKAKCPELSRSFIKKLHTLGLITSSPPQSLELKKMPRPSTLSLEIPPPLPNRALPENIPLHILYEDEHLLVVNKEAGMVTHPAPGHSGGTLANALLFHCENLEKIGAASRPGLVHRLDKGTSGLLVVAKSLQCYEELILLFSGHHIQRVYEAIILGSLVPSQGTVSTLFGRNPRNRLKMTCEGLKEGKRALTHYKELQQLGPLSHLELELETGRTHQIRVHLAEALGHPILCDPLYGRPSKQIAGLNPSLQKLLGGHEYPLLHAKILGLEHPMTGEKLRFEIRPPAFFQKVLHAKHD